MNSVRYLSQEDVTAILPSVADQIELVREAYVATVEGRAFVPATELVHPRDDAFFHAMPAYIADRDIVAMKWIAGYDGNRKRGLPYLTGVIVMNDPETGAATAVMDCSAITAARTAAASGLCIAELAPDDWSTVAIIGYGVQAKAHINVIRHLRADAKIRVNTTNPPRTGIPGVEFIPTVASAVLGADIVITGIPLSARLEHRIRREQLPSRVLLLPIDYDSSIPADLVGQASLFLVDDIAGFELTRSQGRFADWPTPHGSVGHFLTKRPQDGLFPDDPGPLRICCNLGVGTLDALFGDVVRRAADSTGRGVLVG